MTVSITECNLEYLKNGIDMTVLKILESKLIDTRTGVFVLFDLASGPVGMMDGNFHTKISHSFSAKITNYLVKF